jgi:hypothetical protein
MPPNRAFDKSSLKSLCYFALATSSLSLHGFRKPSFIASNRTGLTHPITTATRPEVLGLPKKSFYYLLNLLAKALLVFALEPFYLIFL